MAVQIRYGGIWRDPSGCQIFSGRAWRNILQIKVYKGGAWRTVANFTAPGSGGSPPPSGGGGGGSGGSLTLSLDPNDMLDTVNSSPHTTGSSIATPSGGLAPYSYSWVKLSGDNITVNSPTSAITDFTVSLASGQTKSAIFRCTCTDSLSSTATADITVTVERL